MKSMDYGMEMPYARRAATRLEVDVEDVVLNVDFRGQNHMLRLWDECEQPWAGTSITNLLHVGVNRGWFGYRTKCDDDESRFSKGDWLDWKAGDAGVAWTPLEIYALCGIIEKKITSYVVPMGHKVFAPDESIPVCANYRKRGHKVWVSEDADGAMSTADVEKMWEDVAEDEALLMATKLSFPDKPIDKYKRTSRGCSNKYFDYKPKLRQGRDPFKKIRAEFVEDDGQLAEFAEYML